MSLSAHGVVARLGSFTLGPLSVEVPAGCVTALLGPNGCGKTTLLRVLCGLQPHQGEVRAGGSSLDAMPVHERAERIAFVPQRPGIPPALSVREVVSLARLRLPRDSVAVQRALERVGVAELGDRTLDTLSAGQLHRVAVARALAQRHERSAVLALDEPTAALDPAWTAALSAILREQAARGMAVVLATHDLAFAASCCDRAALLCGGTLDAQGPHGEVATVARLSRVFGSPFAEVLGLGAGPVALPRW